MPKQSQPIRVTERDLDILDALSSYRFLSVPQLAALFFPSDGAAEARLRRLYQAGLAVRVFMPVRPYSTTSCTIYALGAKGAREITARHDGVRPRYLSAQEQRSGLFLDHTLRRNDLRICLELLDRTEPDFQLISWKQKSDDVRAAAYVRTSRRKLERVPIVPDGTFIMRSHGLMSSYAVEIDMGTVSVSRMALRYRAYYRWWQRGNPHNRFGPMPFRVLTLTTNERRLSALRKAAIRAPEHGRKGSALFWFAELAACDITEPLTVLSPAWTTARVQDEAPQPLINP